MFEHVATDDQVRSQLGEMAVRLEQFAAGLDQAVAIVDRAIRVEPDESPRAAFFGDTAQEMAFATANLDDDGARRELGDDEIANGREMLAPDDPLVEHQVRLLGVGHFVVAELRVVDMPAVDATKEVVRESLHRLRFSGRFGPGERRKRLLSPVVEGNRDVVPACGTGAGFENVS